MLHEAGLSLHPSRRARRVASCMTMVCLQSVTSGHRQHLAWRLGLDLAHVTDQKEHRARDPSPAFHHHLHGQCRVQYQFQGFRVGLLRVHPQNLETHSRADNRRQREARAVHTCRPGPGSTSTEGGGNKLLFRLSVSPSVPTWTPGLDTCTNANILTSEPFEPFGTRGGGSVTSRYDPIPQPSSGGATLWPPCRVVVLRAWPSKRAPAPREWARLFLLVMME